MADVCILFLHGIKLLSVLSGVRKARVDYMWNCFLDEYSRLSPCGHSENKLQMFDWNKLPLLRTLANEDTNSRSLQCPL